MVAFQVYVSGAVESWTVAGAFGQRRFVAVTIFLVIGIAALQSWIPSRGGRILINALIVIAVWWNLALTAEFGTGMMDRQKLELGRNPPPTMAMLAGSGVSTTISYAPVDTENEPKTTIAIEVSLVRGTNT